MVTACFAALAEARELPQLLNLIVIALIAAAMAHVYEILLTDPDRGKPLQMLDDESVDESHSQDGE